MALSWPVACLAFAAALESVLAITMRTRMRNSAANPFALGMVLAALWAIDYALDLGTRDFAEKLLLLQLRSTFLPFYALVWFEACYRFVYGRKCLHGWRLAAASTIPAATSILSWVPSPPAFLAFRTGYWLDFSSSYPLLRFSFGPWAAVFYAFTLVVMVACFVLLWTSLRTASWDSTARRLFLIAWIIGTFVNVAYAFNRSPTPGLNYAPIISPLTFGLIALALVRGRIVQLAPVGRGVLIDSLEDMMVVLDANDCLVDLNRPAAATNQTARRRAGRYLLSRA